MPAREGESRMRIRGSDVVRRLSAGACLALIAATSFVASAAKAETRTLHIYNIHTKETAHIVFKRDGRFDDAGLKQINTFMRDWRRNQETKMDPELIDTIWAIQQEIGGTGPVHLISGYRSPATNESLRKTRGGQAKKSQHILGKAADITFPGIPIKQLRNSALIREVGGVGYYPTSGIPFVHVDTGRVRSWPRVPRLELAALFPNGRSQHLPADGKPITARDYQLAMAKGLVKDRPGRTMVAEAPPLPSRSPAPTVAMPNVAVPDATMPQPILASFTPNAPAAAPQLPAAGAKPGPKPFAFASAGGAPSFGKPNLKAASFPLYEDATAIGAAEFEEDHSDELSYIPFEIADLMTDTSVSYSRDELTHPEQKSVAYLFEDMARPTALTLRPTSGYTGLASAQTFSGEAVRNLYADAGQPRRTQVASRR